MTTSEAITSIIAQHPDFGRLAFETARQDRRTYYRLIMLTSDGERTTGNLTDEKHALETIAYWREKGWLAADMLARRTATLERITRQYPNLKGTEGQDRESYSDTQDRENYS